MGRFARSTPSRCSGMGFLGSHRRRSALVAVLTLAVLGGLTFSSIMVGAFAPSHPAAVSGRASATPAAASNDVPCYSLNATICVSVTNSSVPNIIPPAGSHVSPVQPAANASIGLWVRSRYTLVWPGNVSTSGPHSPLSLNATGKLWNGVQYYGSNDTSQWHPTGTSWWSFGPANVNKSYPFYYGLSFTPKSAAGTANFFPGMTLTWWIYIVSNTSGVFSHNSSVPFQFTFQGAWPASPFPASPQYGGPSYASTDLSVSQSPLAPNYNDSVSVTIATTPQDLLTSATIGGAYVDVTESAPDGGILNASTLTFPIAVHNGEGSVGVTIVFPPTLALSPGALVVYKVTAWDTSLYSAGQVGPDLIVTDAFNYTVHGNGTFVNGNFTNDLSLSTSPVVGSTLPAGTPVQVALASNYAGTAIEAAEIRLNFTYAGIGETVPVVISLHRANSTHFLGAIPPLPLGATARFQVVAWDFAQDREISSPETYTIETLSHLLPTVPSNSTFFVVYVYDNGSHAWVSNAHVTIVGLASSGYVTSSSETFGGVAYPNASGEPFVPLLLPAGTSYQVVVNDSSFIPVDSSSSPSVVISVVMPHSPTRTGILLTGANYIVAEAGPALYFYLNQTYSPVSYASPSPFGTGTLLTAAVGLAALTVVGVPLVAWWSTIRARRAEQERRITL